MIPSTFKQEICEPPKNCKEVQMGSGYIESQFYYPVAVDNMWKLTQKWFWLSIINFDEQN